MDQDLTVDDNDNDDQFTFIIKKAGKMKHDLIIPLKFQDKVFRYFDCDDDRKPGASPSSFATYIDGQLRKWCELPRSRDTSSYSWMAVNQLLCINGIIQNKELREFADELKETEDLHYDKWVRLEIATREISDRLDAV